VLEWWRAARLVDAREGLESLPVADTSPALARRPALRAAVAALIEPAARYRAGLPRPPPPPRLAVTGLVRDLEREIGRSAKPFRLMIVEVPVRGLVWERLTPEHLLASTRFRDTPAAPVGAAGPPRVACLIRPERASPRRPFASAAIRAHLPLPRRWLAGGWDGCAATGRGRPLITEPDLAVDRMGTGMGTGQRRATGPAGRVLAAVVVLTLAPSCSGSGSPEQAGPTAVAASAGAGHVPAVVVAGADTAQLPAACGPARVGEVVASLLAAIDAGNVGAVDRLVSPEPEFQWYSVTGRPGERIDGPAESRAGLRGYLLDRHAHGERLRLRAVRVNGSDVRAGILVGRFEYRLTRWADDLPAGNPLSYVGKGALNCSAGRVLVWSMAPEPEARQNAPCPDPPRSVPPDSVIACARSGAS